ncbi:MAG: methyltransferase domain-containing protein [Verrucomicrobia bacterium]|nr:methyltransferase domain-containing protein [Verrucomicrobiota bacterium]
MPSTYYGREFFENQAASSLRSAEAIVPDLIQHLRPRSVVDVGCGVGTWLSVFLSHGMTDVLGIDGDYVDRGMLLVPKDVFMPHDLAEPLRLPRRFDLVLSLETAEHLPPTCAETFVRTLTGLGDVVVFSAAVPGQAWIKNIHLNEQWPDYWVNLFRKNGYDVLDYVRRRVWSNDRVCWWYAQNILLFIKHDRYSAYAHLQNREVDDFHNAFPLSIVHPRFLEQYADFDRMSLARKVWLIKKALKSVCCDLIRKVLRKVAGEGQNNTSARN